MEFLDVILPEDIRREETAGNFSQAKEMLKRRLESDLPEPLRERLVYELERIGRLLADYDLDENEARKKLADSVENFSDTEFEELLGSGALDYVMADGKRRFERRFVPNLVFSKPEYLERFRDLGRRKMIKSVNERVEKLMNGEPPAAYRVVVESRITLKKDIKAEKLFCWLPFPKEENPMDSVKLIGTSHERFFISPERSKQRTIFMEGKPKAGTEFSVKYEYAVREQINEIDPSKVTEYSKRMGRHLGQKSPHIVFTPYMKELTKEITDGEKNPYLKAKRIYDWITTTVRYSYMHAYSVYEEPFPVFVASNLRGDCGVQALTFITMCRIAGVPARWQSGRFAGPNATMAHDWAYFYVEPYGWLPADLSFGGSRKGTKYREFYFGNLDGFRLVFNSGFMAGFSPNAKFIRSDPYDSQVGELQTDEGNVYYDSFDTDTKVVSFEAI